MEPPNSVPTSRGSADQAPISVRQWPRQACCSQWAASGRCLAGAGRGRTAGSREAMEPILQLLAARVEGELAEQSVTRSRTAAASSSNRSCRSGSPSSDLPGPDRQGAASTGRLPAVPRRCRPGAPRAGNGQRRPARQPMPAYVAGSIPHQEAQEPLLAARGLEPDVLNPGDRSRTAATSSSNWAVRSAGQHAPRFPGRRSPARRGRRPPGAAASTVSRSPSMAGRRDRRGLVEPVAVIVDGDGGRSGDGGS